MLYSIFKFIVLPFARFGFKVSVFEKLYFGRTVKGSLFPNGKNQSGSSNLSVSSKSPMVP